MRLPVRTILLQNDDDKVEGYDPQAIGAQWEQEMNDLAEQRAARNGTTSQQEYDKLMSNLGEASKRSKERAKRRSNGLHIASLKTRESGAINGALNDDNDPYYKRREAHAISYYEEVRKRDRKTEIAAVSANSGIGTVEVSKAYDHLFVNEYELENGRARFDPMYEIAESWRRLREGKDIKKHDIVLLNHESFEYDLMASGMSYDDAHDIAQERFNYSKALKEFMKGGV